MKNLKDYKDELHRCSKCGICQNVCPVYKTTKNECSVTRGQFIMLDGVINNKLKLNKKIVNYIDTCVKCNKCKNFCPSNIDVLDILLSAKYEYLKSSVWGIFIRFFESKLVYNNILKFVNFLTHIFNKKNKSQKYNKKCVYFGGCINKFTPSVDNYVISLLNKMEIEVQNTYFNCCGMLFLTTGNLDRFKEQAIENINKIDNDTSLIVTDCASCEWAWKEYHKYIDDKNLLEKLNKLEIKSIYELIKENDIEFSAFKKMNVNYHKPCHETSEDSILNIIKNCDNVEYNELDNYDSCCGFAGLENPHTVKMTGQIIKKKSESIKSSNVDCTLTSCAGCEIALKISTLFLRPVKRMITFLKDNCYIK